MDSGATATYLYDAAGRRAQKAAGGTTTLFFYDQAGRLLGEYDPATGAGKDFIRLPGLSWPLARVDLTMTETALGNVLMVTKSGANVHLDWSKDKPHNTFHLMGGSSKTGEGGHSFASWDITVVFRLGLELLPGLTDIQAVTRYVTNHEKAHQYRVNMCSPEEHDSALAWCDYDNHCGIGGAMSIDCVMNPTAISQQPPDLSQAESGVIRLHMEDLLLGDPLCGGNPRPGAVRTWSDPE